MSTSRASERLTEVFEAAKQHPLHFDDTSKIVLFSDCHRGDNSLNDNFAPNSVLFWHALCHYFDEGFIYIEVGDGDALWEHADFAEIRREHDHVFAAMVDFHNAKRLHLIWGNHDIERQDPAVVRQQLHSYYDPRERTNRLLFGDIPVSEGLVLRHTPSNQQLFVIHGHQAGGLLSDRYWRVGRLLVRHLWRHLELFGVHDPTRPSQNVRQQHEIEDQITAWICATRQPVICGHTHRPSFPRRAAAPYFNTGSCVHPRSLTGIEIVGGKISLIKWWLKPRKDGIVQATREILVGPESIVAITDHWIDCPRSAG